MHSKKVLCLVATVMVIGSWSALFGYDFKAGDYFIWQASGNQMRLDVERCSGSVNGYTALRFINRQDPYGGGSYYADVPGIGWAQIGSDVHDAFSMDYFGISDYTPPLPLFLLDYGAAVGTTAEWIGYDLLEDEDPEGYDKTVWEVLAYEDITVAYGHFQNAMKVFCGEYYTWYYDDPENIPEEDWEFSDSCSEYIWIVPTVGVVKRLGFEDTVPIELVGCKINGQVNPNAGNGSGSGSADLSLSLTAKKIPAYMIIGTSASVMLTAEVKNIGTSPCPQGETVDIYFYLRNLETQQETQVASALNVSVNMLKPNKTKKINANILVPANLDEGTYVFVAKMDDLEVALTEYELTAASSYVDLDMTLKKAKLPSSVIAGSTLKNAISLFIVNNGNAAAASNAKAAIAVVAHAIDDGTDYLLANTEIPLSNLKPLKRKPAKLSVPIPSDIPENNYTIMVTINDEELVIGDIAIAAR